MKKIGFILLLSAFVIQGFSQEMPVENKENNQEKIVADTNELIKVVVGNEKVVVEDDSASVRIRLGNREIIILDSLKNEKSRIEIKRIEEEHSCQDDENCAGNDRGSRRSNFKGHWAGAELGFNNYVTSDKSMSLPSAVNYMSLHSGKSMNFNINFSQLSIGLARHIGFITGLGLNWNNYIFDGNNNIKKGPDGIIEMLDPGELIKKSKFSTLYLNLPFIFEIQIPAGYQRLNISAGPIGAIKIFSHSKMVFENNDKIKSNDDFSLNLLRYGVTTRIGYENFHVYGTYYMMPLFKDGKSPGNIGLYPFEVGLAFTVN